MLWPHNCPEKTPNLCISAVAQCRRAKLPAYADGVYDSRLMSPTGNEVLLYKHYLARPFLSCRAAARTLCMRSAGQGQGALPIKSSLVLGRHSFDNRIIQSIVCNLCAHVIRPRIDNIISVHSWMPHCVCAVSEQTERLPTSESELAAWIKRRLTPHADWDHPFLDLNLAHEYIPEAGFLVAVDGALRLGRLLPCAALVSVFPPGAFYQDNPVRDNVKVRCYTFRDVCHD